MISIIVPVYNVESYIHQCITSILNQTYNDIEILLIDDGSTDKSGDICEKYAQIDSRIRLFHTKNNGLSAARNLGLHEMKGDYIGFIDSDDWIEPDMYDILLSRMKETGADISACEIWHEYVKYSQVGNCVQDAVYTNKEAILALIHNKYYDTVWNKLFKKGCWTGFMFPEGHAYEDIKTVYRVIQNTHFVSSVSKPLYHYRMRSSSIVHRCTMELLKDKWDAHYNRYIDLCSTQEVTNNKDCMNIMQRKLVEEAAGIWRHVYGISKKQRDYTFLYNVSCFIREQYPFFEKKDWSHILRISALFSRYVNDLLFAFLFATKSFISIVGNSRKHLNYQ